nr:hypothetical protein GCM10020092_068560 [Actinoplanes digitatis]
MPVFQEVLKDVRVIGSIVGTRADLTEVFRLHAAGRTRVRYETRRLDDINGSIEDMLARPGAGEPGAAALNPAAVINVDARRAAGWPAPLPGCAARGRAWRAGWRRSS